MRKFFMWGVPVILVALACIGPVLAQAEKLAGEEIVAANTVTAPIGSWTVQIAQWINTFISPTALTVLSGYAMVAIQKVYPWAAMFLSQRRVEMMLKAGLDYGLNAAVGAAKGQVLTVPVGIEVIAKAVQYLIDTAPAAVVEAAGGPKGLAQRIFRLLELDVAANDNNVLMPAIKRVTSQPAYPVQKAA